MKYGVGQWTAILKTGLLPGKVIGQLNNQTQRLLGQQSLAVFTGLCVDIKRVQKDNEARQGVTRKGGIIINSGGKLTQEERDSRRTVVMETYELTQQQKLQVDEEFEKLQEKRYRSQAAMPPRSELVHSYLLGSAVRGMERQAKLELLQELRDETERLYKLYHGASGPLKTSSRSCDVKKRELSTALNPPVAKKTRRAVRKKMELEEELQVDPVAVETLVDMGYSDRHAVDALLENANELEAAVRWLILNCN